MLELLTPETLGLAAASLAILGAVWTAVRRLKRTLQGAQQRMASIELALESRPVVEFTADALCWAPGLAAGVLQIQAGQRGTLQSCERGWCLIRLDRQTTSVEAWVGVLRLVS